MFIVISAPTLLDRIGKDGDREKRYGVGSSGKEVTAGYFTRDRNFTVEFTV